MRKDAPDAVLQTLASVERLDVERRHALVLQTVHQRLDADGLSAAQSPVHDDAAFPWHGDFFVHGAVVEEAVDVVD